MADETAGWWNEIHAGPAAPGPGATRAPATRLGNAPHSETKAVA